jgi:arginase
VDPDFRVADVNKSARIALIGVPSSAGARMAGQEQAPRRLRAAGLVQKLASVGLDVTDLGDLTEVSFSLDPENPKLQNLHKVLGVLTEVTGAVDSAVRNQDWPLVIGGDCSITIGVLAALVKHCPDFGLIYLDGDVDLNTPETTLSGIIDGMVIAHVVGWGADELRNFGPRCPLLEQRDIALFGYSVQAGGLDPVEIELLRGRQLLTYPLEEIVGDVADAARNALARLESNKEKFLVHFDVDVIDFRDFPAVDVPHRPGLTLTQTIEVLRVFASSPKAAGLVVSEFNADQDPDGILAQTLVCAIQSALKTRL